MDTNTLKKFAQNARQDLRAQVAAKMTLVLGVQSDQRRDSPDIIKKLEKDIAATSLEEVIEKVAYTWFNRFCALRFMDANGYNKMLVVSPREGQTQPDILAEAKQGNIDENIMSAEMVANIGKKIAQSQTQLEAYRLLLVAVCNHYHTLMPFLFEKIADYTELLLPDDLLSEKSVLAQTAVVMSAEDCAEVEIIGWLYQFYISEKKDEVFAALKKNKKITPENIPAATQLFTPHWIVRYLLENSLGRLWMLNHPSSNLTAKMDYYIAPDPNNGGQVETDFLVIKSPEEIRICDPACGSGHMLTYAFDLLYAIYEEEGYDPSEIPTLILTNNLHGIEIDERAGALAAFALTMKARGKQRRFFRKKVAPQICVLDNIEIKNEDLQDYMDFVGADLFSAKLQTTLGQFKEAKNFGALIRPTVTDISEVLDFLQSRNVSSQLLLHDTHKAVLKALKQADFLSPKYHVVVANPPYMEEKKMNKSLRSYSKVCFPLSKNDFYSMFIERNGILTYQFGYVAMITMQSWMYLKRFIEVRRLFLNEKSLLSLLHLGPHAFPEIQGERVQVAAFVHCNSNPNLSHCPVFFRLIFGKGKEKEVAFLKRLNQFSGVEQDNFLKLPDLSIAYKLLSNSYLKEKLLTGDMVEIDAKIGSQPGAELILFWWEVSLSRIGIRWQKYNKGGTFRRWYGNAIWVLDYGKNGENVISFGGQLSNQGYYGRPHISWTRVSSNINLRFYRKETYFDNTSPAIFEDLGFIQGYLNSIIGEHNRTGKFSGTKIEAGHVESIAPISPTSTQRAEVEKLVTDLVHHSSADWDAFETSWDFTQLPLLLVESDKCEVESKADLSTFHSPLPTISYPLTTSLKQTYTRLRAHWQQMTDEMQCLEQENNRIFIDAYGLQDELDADVPLQEITLTCNPHYRYKLSGKWEVGSGQEEERENRLLADTMREFLSYAVGCMFGRYALDAPGLILASAGETLEDYFDKCEVGSEEQKGSGEKETSHSPRSTPHFLPDEDNVIPILDGDWFTDDITERFREFLRVTFGTEHYDENLAFIEAALGKDIRKFFLKEFYPYHVKRYKKRPIYWLFSSPKGSFQALVYLHRYQGDTVSIVLNDYLRPFRTKLENSIKAEQQKTISATLSKGDKNRALKQIANWQKTVKELEVYEKDILYPLASQKIELDLDDGVKVNYPKFGKALKKVAGLS